MPYVFGFENVMKPFCCGIAVLRWRRWFFTEQSASDNLLGLVVEGFIEGESPRFVILVFPEVLWDSEFVEHYFRAVENVKRQLFYFRGKRIFDSLILILPELFNIEWCKPAILMGLRH